MHRLKHEDEYRVLKYRKEEFGYLVVPEKGDVFFCANEAEELLETCPQVRDLGPFRLQAIEIDFDTFRLKSPVHVTLEMTLNCNLACESCYIEAHEGILETDALTKERVFQLLEEMQEMEVYEVDFTGGEPFLRKDIVEIVNRAIEMGFKVNVISNGLPILEEHLRELHKDMFIKVSIDGVSPKANLHGNISFDHMKKRLLMIQRSGIGVCVICTVHSQMIGELDEMLTWLSQHGIPFDVAHCMPLGRALKHPYLIPQLEHVIPVHDTLDKFRRIKRSAPREARLTRENYLSFLYNLGNLTRSCSGCGKGSAYITSRGVVYPCGNCASARLYPAGNIFETDFEEIWFNHFRDYREIGWDDFVGCKDCRIAAAGYFCPFRCPPLSKAIHGDEFVCGATEFVKELIWLSHQHD